MPRNRLKPINPTYKTYEVYMRVKFTNLSFVTKEIKHKYIKAVQKFLDRSNFILTGEVKNFETAFARAVGTRFAVGVSNGADALYLALISLGVKAGDEVITQGNAYNATVTAILRTGAVPRFADINPKTLCLDVKNLESLINRKTKVILPVHLYGMANNMKKIIDIAKRRNLVVVEDCAQAHFAEYKNKQVGTFGKVNAFSFYPTKNLGAFGDAGAITTNNKKIYEKLLVLRNLGQTAKNNHQVLGFNMRLDPMQAIALSLKLPFLKKWTKARFKAGEYYNNLIKKMKLKVLLQEKNPGATHVYHLYAIRLLGQNRDKVQKKLLELGVESGVYYPVPVYNQPFYKFKKDPCPVTDLVCGQILCLPMFSGITKKEQKYAVSCLKEALKEN